VHGPRHGTFDDPVDGRAQQVWLTRKAKALEEPATQAAWAQNAVALAGLTEQERAVFLDLMRKAIRTMRSSG
jgi:DNA-binding MarR family transcriptional regulator